VSDGDTINGAFVGQLCGSDWGLWRTTKMNVERTRESLPGYEFSVDERGVVADRLDALWQAIDDAPKSTRWKIRDRVGDRVKWYEEPEEVD
jgi:hypothetical protein